MKWSTALFLSIMLGFACLPLGGLVWLWWFYKGDGNSGPF
jgi:hypothetical protein